jgi:hypothetical protein
LLSVLFPAVRARRLPAVRGLNYNFGERPAGIGPVPKGQTAESAPG